MSNIQPYIILNGTDSRTISGLLISSLPPISKPQVRTQVETVDGRDGDLVTKLGFEAYDKVIKIGLTYNYDIDDIIEYFNSEGVVIFSNEPDKYYRYAIYEAIDFEKLIRFKTAEVTLHVQPFKFSTTEEPELFTVVSGQDIEVTNEGNTDARPNLTIIGSGDIDVSLNGSQILSIELEDDQAVIIDSEDMNAYAAQSAIREVEVDITAQQAGSGTPSPSNIRAITGYNACNITLCGKNLVDFISNLQATSNGLTISATSDGGIHYSGTTTASWAILTTAINVFIPKDTALTLSRDTVFNYNHYITATYTDNTTENFIIVGGSSAKSVTFSKDVKTIRLDMSGMINGATYNDTVYLQLEKGSQATEYEAYESNITSIDLTTTVYDGSLNVITGELISNADYFSVTANYFSNIATTGGVLRAFTTPNFANRSLLACDCLNINGNVTTVNSIGITSDNRIYVTPDWAQSVSNIDEFKTLLASNPINTVLSKATPAEIQLTPTQIYNLLGVNNMYSDTGDITVKHKANGVIVTDTGAVVSFYAGLDDIEKGVLLNRAITGDYDKIRLKKGVNTFVLTGNARQFVIDKFSRWI